MNCVFLGGIPASGKTHLARAIAKAYGIAHFTTDEWRKEMRKDPNLKRWLDFFWNQDEKTYLARTSCDDHWRNLVWQSEALWPFLVKKISEVVKKHERAIIEGVNLLPHLVAKRFPWPAVFLLGESYETIRDRNRKEPRWGTTQTLQDEEARLFYACEGKKYKEEAVRFGYRVYRSPREAEKEIRARLAPQPSL